MQYFLTEGKKLMGISEDHIVEKSVSLLEAKDMPFNLGELKILDTFLSRINARDDSCTSVVFSFKEYSELLGVERIKPSIMNEYVKGLMQKVLSVPVKNEKGDIIRYQNYILFHKSACFKDPVRHEWMVELNCTEEAKKMFFNISELRYVHYALKNIISFGSFYTMQLYFYVMRQLPFKKTWTEDLISLRDALRLGNNTIYEQYRYLNYRILSPAVKEINEKSDIFIEYEKVLGGKSSTRPSVSAVRFFVKTGNSKQMSFSDYVEIEDKSLKVASGGNKDEDEKISAQLKEISNNEFSQAQMNEIIILIRKAVPFGKEYPRGIDCARMEYVTEVYAKLQTAAEKTKIDNRFAYLKGIIKKDCPE